MMHGHGPRVPTALPLALAAGMALAVELAGNFQVGRVQVGRSGPHHHRLSCLFHLVHASQYIYTPLCIALCSSAFVAERDTGSGSGSGTGLGVVTKFPS